MVDNQSILYPRSSIALKKWLLRLNRDLDSIKSAVGFSCDYYFYLGHSITPTDTTLCALERAVLAVEDRNFFRHRGVEIKSFVRAFRRKLSGRRFGGVSTIDQQLVRVVTRRYERTFSRKFAELLLAFIVNFHLPKKKMLHFYINNAYFGWKLIGCEAACKFIFGLSAADVNSRQAAFASCLLPLPFPKIAHGIIETEGVIVGDPSEFLDREPIRDTRWAIRMRYRYKNALRFQDFNPKSR